MILASMESIIRKNDKDDNTKVFLYVIQPVTSTDDEMIDSESDSWRGKIHYTHNLIKNKFEAIYEEVKYVQNDMRTRITNLQANLQNQIN